MNRKFGLIGYPLGHSFSPYIHKWLFDLSDKKAEYMLYEIAPEKLKSEFGFLKTLDGFNITIPHKIPIIEITDKLDPIAQRYGTINCVRNDNGIITGYNTDVIGFTKSIEIMGASLKSKVLLLGCGGVGRMMALETAFQGGELTIAVRSGGFEVAENVKKHIEETIDGAKVNVCSLDEISGHYDLMINSTPVGMYPKVDAMPVKEEVLDNVDYVFDAVYNPRETMLITKAKIHNAKVMGGMAMLVLQAVAAHEIWDGYQYENDDISILIKEMESNV